MNALKIPGFTAEASLYKTTGHYRVAGAGNDPARSREILPQLPIGFCMANCDHIQDPFLRDVCNLNCLDTPGTGGGGGTSGPQCLPGCTPCRTVPGQPGRWKTCVNRKCEDREVRCH